MKSILSSLILLLLAITAYSQTTGYHDWDKDTVKLQEAVVYASLRATNATPFSFSNVTKTTLESMPGAEAAYTLSSTPSITFYGDNGSSLGYVYYRLRGIDQTRLNVTLNGVPLNEPEDQGSYFNNFPNFLSAINDVQIIRGAGLSRVGTSTFGGSLNFESKSGKPTDFINGGITYGAYGTKMITASVNTSHFFIGGSKYTTDGYKYHSGNQSWSTNYGADFKLFGQKTKFFGILGKQENGMAWVGETLDQISIDPRSNTNKAGEKDNFFNMHNQLTFENTSIRNSKITYTIFHQYQNGWYDTDISLFDPSLKESELMSRIKLNFNWVGVIYNQSFTFNRFTTNFGANYNMQRRNHVGLENYQDSGFAEIYSNTGVKQEFTQYIKAEYKILGLSLYGDIQSRYVNYRYRSQPINLTLYNNQHFNYSGGASFKLSNVVIHYGIGKTTREPRRSDILGGLDNYQGSLNILKDESVYSQDAGIKFTGNKLEASVNMYDMQFKNEFMPTGLYGENSIGLYKNVDESYRRGVEISGKYKSDKLEVSGNLTLSKNRYQSKDNNIPGPTVFMKWNKSILSPDAVGNINVMYKFDKFWFVGVNTRYNSKTFIDLDNTYNLPAFCVLDGYIGATRKMVEFRLNINNLTNSLILTNGMIGFDGSPRYFVMSKINTLFTLKIKI